MVSSAIDIAWRDFGCWHGGMDSVYILRPDIFKINWTQWLGKILRLLQRPLLVLAIVWGKDSRTLRTAPQCLDGDVILAVRCHFGSGFG